MNMGMTNQTEIQVALGQRLKRRRLELGRKQGEVAVTAGISASYFSEIENGKSVPPPHERMAKILSALEFCEAETYELLQFASIARGLLYGEADLPEEVQSLIREIRLHANDLSPRFLKGLHAKIREALG
jgi:transcriptional regulator with XRE-family HTH domain